MFKLIRLALSEKRQRRLVILMLFSMCLLTISTQLEIITIGVLTRKGPGFFELFGPIKEGELRDTGSVTKEELIDRFNAIKSDGAVTKADVAKFLERVKPQGLVDRAFALFSRFLPIEKNPLYLALLVFLIALFNAVCMFVYRFTTKLAAIRISRDLRQRYFEHIQALPMSFYQGNNIGSLSARVVTDAVAVADGINAALTNYLQTPFTILTTMLLCFFTSWKLSLFVFLGFPFIAYPILLIARHIRRVAREIQRNQERFSTILIDFLAGVQTIKLFGRESFSLKKYSEENRQMARLEKKSAKYDVSSRPIVHTLGMTFLSGALILGLYLFEMSIPEVLVYAGLLYIFYEPIKKFAETNTLVQRGAAAAERMDEVLSITPTETDLPGAVPAEFKEEIRFEKVSFRYGSEWVLKNISFSIKKGQTVAIVGPTGSGKSTIATLLPRLYYPQEGTIFLDGKPLSSYTQRSLCDQMAFVPQRPFLFVDTIAANIAFGNEATKSEIILAAERAHALEFIEKLPQKFDTFVSEMGKNLSGGQQQRLAIARALIKKAPLLILDEATSALDALSEQRIKEAIKALRKDHTQLIIAHRLSTIEDADKILYLDSGELIGEGSLEELLASCPPFKAMWELMLGRETASV